MNLYGKMEIERAGEFQTVEISGELIRGFRGDRDNPPEPDEIEKVTASVGVYEVELTGEEIEEAKEILFENGREG